MIFCLIQAKNYKVKFGVENILQIRSSWKFHQVYRATRVNFAQFFTIDFIKNTPDDFF